MRLLLTGATGFVGQHLAESINRLPDMDLTCAMRSLKGVTPGHEIEVQGLDADTNWTSALKGQQVVIHAAARAHVMKETAHDPLSEYRNVNVDGTLNLAQQAAAHGVQRFIFLSSINVNGNVSYQPFTEEAKAAPADFYAQSKWEAERGLRRIQEETEMEIVIIRSPLVYGPQVPGNFGALIRWVERGFPLPFGAIYNSRSLVGVDNLVDLIITCIGHPAAANQVFLAGDGEDLSTTELFQGVAQAMGRPPKLIPVPAGLLMFCATVLGKKAVAQRLLGSLQVDISKARNTLGWAPPFTVAEGLAKAVGNERA